MNLCLRICSLLFVQSPTGVRKLVLQTVAILLGDVSLPLLPRILKIKLSIHSKLIKQIDFSDMSVHRPVRNLIRRLTLNPQPTRIPSTPTKSLPLDIPKKDGDGLPMVQPDSEFVTLLETLANKLVKDPSLIGFFIDELQFEVHAYKRGKTKKLLMMLTLWLLGRWFTGISRPFEAFVGPRICWWESPKGCCYLFASPPTSSSQIFFSSFWCFFAATCSGSVCRK